MGGDIISLQESQPLKLLIQATKVVVSRGFDNSVEKRLIKKAVAVRSRNRSENYKS